MAKVAGFFNDRRGVAAIDYAFVVALAYTVRAIALHYGETVGPILRHALRVV